MTRTSPVLAAIAVALSLAAPAFAQDFDGAYVGGGLSGASPDRPCSISKAAPSSATTGPSATR
ncbi:MAG: hypothetical protein R3D80_18940 [Paracoccaceae bacterium]